MSSKVRVVGKLVVACCATILIFRLSASIALCQSAGGLAPTPAPNAEIEDVGASAVPAPGTDRASSPSLSGEWTVVAGSDEEVLSVPLYPRAIEAGRLHPDRSIEGLPDDSAWQEPCSNWICGVQCDPCFPGPEPRWPAMRPIPWEVFAQGEYIGPHRRAHLPVYRLRVDDHVAFAYRLSGQVALSPYQLNVGDRLSLESSDVDPNVSRVVNREVIIQPDGRITLPMLGQVTAAGLTVEELRADLEQRYLAHIRAPMITVTPTELNSTLKELRSTVDRRYGLGGQFSEARVTPEGSVQLPAIGSVPAQGLTVMELKREVEERYAQVVEGLEVTPILVERAPRYVYVVGEVRAPGRYVLEAPTTVIQAIAMAGSWNVGAYLRHVVVFRRDEDWRLVATKLDLYGALQGHRPCPADEIWLRDSDIVIVPKNPILVADDFIDLVFTRGIYGVFPMAVSLNFAKLSSL